MADDESNKNLDAYVGVDPIYQNSASVHNRPYTPGDQAEAIEAFKDAQPVGPWTHSADEVKADEDGFEAEDDEDGDVAEDDETETPVTPPPAPAKVAARPVRK